MTFFARPILPIAFGAFLICTETCRHADSILALPASWTSLPFDDWAAGAFLVYGGFRSRRDWSRGHLYQVAAWAFSVCLLLGAFAAHLEEWVAGVPADDWIPEGTLVIVIGALLAVSSCGLVSTIARAQRRHQDAGTAG